MGRGGHVSYEDFLRGKGDRAVPVGFEPDDDLMSPALFDWQRAIVRWACLRGRACIFADCGLGKTAMQIEWSRQAVRDGGAALVVAPLAVATQTVAEGEKFGIPVERAREQPSSPSGVYVTNYEMLHRFDLSSFRAVVLDESSIIKSHDSRTRVDLTARLRDVPYVLCCTATPAPNDQMEIGTHAEVCGAMTRSEMLATFFVHDGGDTYADELPVSLWQRWASPVWEDIDQGRTLNGRAARDGDDERHICPLQLDVIDRCLALWSNPGDLVLSPFAGIGSEGYEAVRAGRQFVGIELKPSYYNVARRNLAEAERTRDQMTLFDAGGAA